MLAISRQNDENCRFLEKAGVNAIDNVLYLFGLKREKIFRKLRMR